MFRNTTFFGGLFGGDARLRMVTRVSRLLASGEGWSDKGRAALQEALQSILDHPETGPMLQARGYDLPTLRELYLLNARSGLGRMHNGHWLALSSLAYPKPLAALLNAPSTMVGCFTVLELYGAY